MKTTSFYVENTHLDKKIWIMVSCAQKRVSIDDFLIEKGDVIENNVFVLDLVGYFDIEEPHSI